MSPANIEFLESTYHHWVTLRDAQYMRGLNAHERDGMIRVMREEFQPGYSCDLWCPPCVSNMVTLLFRLYDEWKVKQPVKANFPKHEGGKHKAIDEWLKQNKK